MPTFGVRSILRWLSPAAERKKYVYEERVTLWNANTMVEALDLAEKEAETYASTHNAKRLGLLQGFWLFDVMKLQKQGIEAFSLLRESDLPPRAYLTAFFDTGYEMEGDCDHPLDGPRRRTGRIPRKRTRR